MFELPLPVGSGLAVRLCDYVWGETCITEEDWGPQKRSQIFSYPEGTGEGPDSEAGLWLLAYIILYPPFLCLQYI